ncbi:hypothetical protein CR513_01457, partial [Mucuna pruriens]
MKPFRESYKFFKDHFFWVAASRYSAKDLMALKKRVSRSTTPTMVGAIVEAVPLAVVRPEPSRPAEETVLPPPMVTLDSLDNSLVHTNFDVGDSTAKRLAEEGAVPNGGWNASEVKHRELSPRTKCFLVHSFSQQSSSALGILMAIAKGPSNAIPRNYAIATLSVGRD